MNKSENHPSIFIETERPYYHPGDTVSGHINLNFAGSDFPGNQLNLKIKGKEETSWEVPPGNPADPAELKHGLIIFYNHKFPIHIWNEGHVPAGQYDFPFSFVLKDFLPGSYTHKRDENDRKNQTSAAITYKLKAECLALDIDREMSKIKTSKELMVREKLKGNSSSKGDIAVLLSSCFCLSQGHCQIRCFFEKNAYESGEEANIYCEIDNSAGSLPIKSILFELKNKVVLRSDDGANREYIRTIFLKETNGLAAYQKAEGLTKKAIQFKLNSNQGNLEEFKDNEADEAIQLQESSGGQLINSSYCLEVTAKASGFLNCKPSEKTQIPVTIYKRIGVGKKIEGDWNPQIMDVTVIVISEGNFYRRSKKVKY